MSISERAGRARTDKLPYAICHTYLTGNDVAIEARVIQYTLGILPF
ncbi:hypothetical protein HNQ39_003983 [Armatimonas rosea]|uniref:Uncharacterized protein n=1 Tax=Armatimonas rosea TaxID=685828 RepID=A0A7W9SSQ3_ARMRO|nr:hypothetical protein [Armatimonas rosea]